MVILGDLTGEDPSKDSAVVVDVGLFRWFVGNGELGDDDELDMERDGRRPAGASTAAELIVEPFCETDGGNRLEVEEKDVVGGGCEC